MQSTSIGLLILFDGFVNKAFDLSIAEVVHEQYRCEQECIYSFIKLRATHVRPGRLLIAILPSDLSRPPFGIKVPVQQIKSNETEQIKVETQAPALDSAYIVRVEVQP